MVVEEGAVEGDHGAPPHGWPIDRPQRAQVDGGEIGELYPGSERGYKVVGWEGR